MFLLTDTGGTKTRIALADLSGILKDTVRSFSNVEFSGFAKVIEAYIADGALKNLEACCFAFAGPVQGRAPRLTNLNWQIDADLIEQRVGAPVHLMNDLEAMGRAISELGPEDVQSIAGRAGDDTNGQMLAVGLGTGMNVCAVKNTPDGSVEVWACEYGHSPMTAMLHDEMRQAGLKMEQFQTVEHLFSGGGLAQVRQAGVPDAQYCGWLAQLCAALNTQFLPLGGLYLAGGVSRAILASAGPAVFDSALSAAMDPNLSKPFVSLITSDTAALKGCLARLKSA